MKRFDPGELLLAAIAVLFVAITFWILIRAAWQSPELRDVPATPTVRVIVLPTSTVYTFVPLPTWTPEPREMLLAPTRTPTVTSTRVPTMTPTPAGTRVPTQRG